MTELERIAYAKSFIDKLANGINPVDDTPVVDDDVVNNVRVSRCLFYVSDVLRQIIDNGGIARNGKNSKLPFDITAEQLQEFRYSDTPLTISEITKRINSLIDSDSMRELRVQDITSWLVESGLLEEQFDSMGKKVKRPTSNGYTLGLLIETKFGRNGEYQVVLYNRNLQGFIIDNMDPILSFKNNK